MIFQIIQFLIFSFLPSYTSVKGPGFNIQGPFTLVFSYVAASIFVFVGSLAWVYLDAKKRDRNGFVAILLILLTGWPVSFVWWFWLRPPLLRQEEAQPSLPVAAVR